METIRECWDADVEARLNAKTVHSRFSKVYNKFFPGYNETHTWEKGLDYDDSTKKVSEMMGFERYESIEVQIDNG